MKPIPVIRSAVRLAPDPHRVITKPFLPGEQVFPDGQSRARLIIERILAMQEADVASTLETTLNRFGSRHKDLVAVLEQHFEIVAHHVDDQAGLSRERRLLIGAYFTHEYSIEAAALSNPSMVPAEAIRAPTDRSV